METANDVLSKQIRRQVARLWTKGSPLLDQAAIAQATAMDRLMQDLRKDRVLAQTQIASDEFLALCALLARHGDRIPWATEKPILKRLSLPEHFLVLAYWLACSSESLSLIAERDSDTPAAGEALAATDLKSAEAALTFARDLLDRKKGIYRVANATLRIVPDAKARKKSVLSH